jgi:putative transposon-encoded protein
MKHKFTVEGFELIEKRASKGYGDSARVYLPKKWEGKKTAIIRTEK